MLIFRIPPSHCRWWPFVVICFYLSFRIALSINKCKHKTKQTRTKHPGKTKQPTFGHNKFQKKSLLLGIALNFYSFSASYSPPTCSSSSFASSSNRCCFLPRGKPFISPGTLWLAGKWAPGFRHTLFLPSLPQLLTFFVRKNSAPKILVTQKKRKLLMGAKGGLSTHQHRQTLTHTHTCNDNKLHGGTQRNKNTSDLLNGRDAIKIINRFSERVSERSAVFDSFGERERLCWWARCEWGWRHASPLFGVVQSTCLNGKVFAMFDCGGVWRT